MAEEQTSNGERKRKLEVTEKARVSKQIALEAMDKFEKVVQAIEIDPSLTPSNIDYSAKSIEWKDVARLVAFNVGLEVTNQAIDETKEFVDVKAALAYVAELLRIRELPRVEKLLYDLSWSSLIEKKRSENLFLDAFF